MSPITGLHIVITPTPDELMPSLRSISPPATPRDRRRDSANHGHHGRIRRPAGAGHTHDLGCVERPECSFNVVRNDGLSTTCAFKTVFFGRAPSSFWARKWSSAARFCAKPAIPDAFLLESALCLRARCALFGSKRWFAGQADRSERRRDDRRGQASLRVELRHEIALPSGLVVRRMVPVAFFASKRKACSLLTARATSVDCRVSLNARAGRRNRRRVELSSHLRRVNMTREKKTNSRPDDPRRALATFGRAVDRLARLVGGDDIVGATGALDGLMAFGPVATIGLLRVASDRARGNPALHARLVRLIGAIGVADPKARRSALALLCASYEGAPYAMVTTDLALACVPQEELQDYVRATRRLIAIDEIADP